MKLILGDPGMEAFVLTLDWAPLMSTVTGSSDGDYKALSVCTLCRYGPLLSPSGNQSSLECMIVDGKCLQVIAVDKQHRAITKDEQ